MILEFCCELSILLSREPLVASSPRSANAVTGLELLRQCEGRSPQGLEALGPILCVTYLSGILDGYQVGTIAVDVSRRALCPPIAGIENEQTKLIVEKWL